jgi:hypothetical protein
MILALRKQTNQSVIYGLSVYTAAILAFCMLLRASEYIPTNSNHYCRSNDILFTFMLANGSTNIIPSYEIYGRAELLPMLHEVIITIRSAKNDTLGYGNRSCFRKRNTSGFNAVDVCLASTLFHWAFYIKLYKDHPFFASQGFTLTHSRMQAAIKAIASQYGFNSSRFGTHSLRIGGATALAVAGTPHHIIQQFGRWKSNQFLKYIRRSLSDMELGIQALSRTSTLKSSDVIRLTNTSHENAS